jgi:hypothetical protein
MRTVGSALSFSIALTFVVFARGAEAMTGGGLASDSFAGLVGTEATISAGGGGGKTTC